MLEILTVLVFTIDYICRFYVAGEEDLQYRGFVGRLRFMCTFFSLVDLVSIVPFYVDFAVPGNLPASQFLRMFRLLRMMKMEGRYIEAFTLIDDVVREQKGVLGTAMFVGASTWVICSSFYYVAEHRNKDAIYCGASGSMCNVDAINVHLCTFDEWGLVNCTLGGCAGTVAVPYPCWNLYQSIPGAAFFTLLNLFGEFPLIDQHSVAGKFVGTVVAVVAVAVFAIPAGILGNGFEDLLARRREQKEQKEQKERNARNARQGASTIRNDDSELNPTTTMNIRLGNGEALSTSTNDAAFATDAKNTTTTVTTVTRGNSHTCTGQLYNFLSAQTFNGLMFEYVIMFLIFGTTLTFMMETTSLIDHNSTAVLIIEMFELIAVIVFTVEYICRVVTTVQVEPKYNQLGPARGTFAHCITFFAMIDLLSILPYWIDFIYTTTVLGKSPFSSTSASSTFIRCLRLLRILKAEKYTHAFTVFDDVILANSEVLVVTGFSAMVMWILFSALMYFAERDNADPTMRMYYNTVPNSMWMTLLNLSGEAPLCHYTGLGKILVGIIGVFATGFFGIPIGLLGAGFEEWIEENEETEEVPFNNGVGFLRNEQGGIGDGSGAGSGILPDSPLLTNDNTLASGVTVDEDGLQLSTHHSHALGTLRGGRRTQHHSFNDAFQQESYMELMGRFLDPSATVNDNVNGNVKNNDTVATELIDTNHSSRSSSSLFSCLEVGFDLFIFFLIFMTVALGCLETIDTLQCDDPDSNNNASVCNVFVILEWIAVVVFTIEYMARVVVAPFTPDALLAKRTQRQSTTTSSCWVAVPRLSFILSFYSFIDILAILPFYIAEAMPGGWVDQHDEYFRMLRLFRLLKLDKYIPSISLIDDVFRLKKHSLLVTGFVSGALWILFSALQYLTEFQDTTEGIDPLPDYGCYENCTMANRFSSVVSALTYTCVHLTGDYPIVTYSFWGRVVCFFMVLVAVGVVSIPSGLIASGFAQIVQSKTILRQKKKEEQQGLDQEDILRRDRLHSTSVGDGYYELKYAELDGVEVPTCTCCGWSRDSALDRLQVHINLFLNGKSTLINADTQETTIIRTQSSSLFRHVILFLIVTNVIAVLVESIPQVDRYVGNDSYNFFDLFELISVLLFAMEYMLRIFSVIKDREHLYSIYFYATTFFGIVDLIAFFPYFVEQCLIQTHVISSGGDTATIFRLFRIFRILQLEHFVVAFTVLDNVFRASKDVLKATGLMALIIWIGCGALFFIAEQNNPNWRHCTDAVPLTTSNKEGCYDFISTKACNARWPDQCTQVGFVNMPDSLYYTAVFLGGEWGKIDFTILGRLTCIFLCVAGIAIYAIPIGVLFDSFGAVLGMGGEVEEEEKEEKEEEGEQRVDR